MLPFAGVMKLTVADVQMSKDEANAAKALVRLATTPKIKALLVEKQKQLEAFHDIASVYTTSEGTNSVLS